MKQRVLMFFLFLFTICAEANDGVFYLSGNQLVPMQETDISVTKEVLSISLCDDGMADVDVYYEFHNDGVEKTVLVGFEANAPYNAADDFSKNGVHPYIHDFSVEMNGMLLHYSNGVYSCGLENGAEPIDLNDWEYNNEYCNLYNAKLDSICCFSYVYKFNATFRPGTNVIHHSYRYNLSRTVCSVFNLDYKLTPATRWANHKIDDFTLHIVAKNTAKHFTVNASPFVSAPFKVVEGKGKVRRVKRYEDIVYEVSLRNGVLEWHALDFSPKEELSIVSADELYTAESYVQGIFYDRSANYNPKLCFYGDVKIDSRILRNLPYAHRGYVFSSKDLRNYFNRLWWYMPDPSWKASTADFTPTELEYIKK